MTQFQSMSAEEQTTYAQQFQQYIDKSIPQIGNAQSAEEIAIFEQGMEYLSAFPRYENFINETRRFRDYQARVAIFLGYIPKVQKLIVKLAPQQITLTPHRGRPTKAEQAARKAQEEEKRKEDEKHSLFSPTLQPLPQEGSDGAESQSSPVSSDVSLDNTLQAAALSGTALHLDQLAFLLSEDLANTVTNGNIRTMRRQFEDAYSQAKVLAEQGKEEEAATQAQLAHDLNEQIEGIYQQVDEELAAAYIRLKEDDPYIAEITAKVKDLKEVIAIVRPYHKKVSEAQPDFDEKVRAQIKENAPEAVAAREAKKATHDKAAAIIKYLRRTDKPNTDKRIATMRKKLDELHELIGAEADAYEPLLQKAMEDNKQ